VASTGGRGFPLFWAGRAASQFGDEITLLALPWLVAEATESPLAVGLLQAFAFLPVLLLGLPLGVVADRRSRRRSMIESDLGRMALLGCLPLAVAVGAGSPIGLVLVVAFVAGACRSLFDAASQAFLADLVPSTEIVRSNARLSLTEGVAIVAGPTFAGILIAWIGAAGAITFDAATFAVSAAAVALMSPVSERRSSVLEGARDARRAGLVFIRNHVQVRSMTLALAAANLGSGIAGGLIVLFFQLTLRLPGWQAGLAYAANGVGVLVASALSPRLAARLGFGRTIIAGLGAGCVGFGLLAAAAGAARSPIAATGMAFIGLGVTISVVASASLRQRVVPGELLGRVTAGYRIVVSGAIAVGALVGGVLGEVAGVRVALAAATAIYLIVIVSVLFTPLNAAEPLEPAPSV